jgi:hypothetical protein
MGRVANLLDAWRAGRIKVPVVLGMIIIGQLPGPPLFQSGGKKPSQFRILITHILTFSRILMEIEKLPLGKLLRRQKLPGEGFRVHVKKEKGIKLGEFENARMTNLKEV